MAVYGYARCSTKEDRQDIARQERELKARGAEKIFSEYISGAAISKPEFDKLLEIINEGDTLATTEISRFSRNVHYLCHLEKVAETRKIKLECGVLTLDYTADKVDPMNRAMYYMMGVFAELERGITVERIKSGIKNAKEKNVQLGRPRKSVEDVPKVVLSLLPKYKAGHFNKTEYAKRAGISRQSLYKYLRLLDETAINEPEVIPKAVIDLLPKYKAGHFNKTEYAKRAGISRQSLYKYLRLLDAAVADAPEVVPEKVRELYPQYKAGELNKSEFARRAGVVRNTIKKYISILERDV